MTRLPQWISFDGALGDIASVIPEIESWAELAAHWRDIGEAIWKLGKQAPVDSPLRLAQYVTEHAGDAEVVEIFEKLKLTELHGRLATIGAKLSDPASTWHKLLQPVSEFAEGDPGKPEDAGFGFDASGEDGELTLEIPRLAPSAATALGPASLTFDLGLKAGIECEAGSPWPFRSDDVSGALLRIGGEGMVTTRAGISLPFGQIGNGTAHAGASCEAAIGFYFRPDAQSDPYARVLAKAVGGLPNPLDLDSLSHAMALCGLEGIALGCRGSAEGGLGIVLGKQFEIARLASGTLGVTADVSFRRNGQWIVSLRRTAAGMRFVLSRDDQSEHNWSAGVGIKLDAAPLARKVHDLLIEGKDFVGPALEKIKPFLSPGTYLANEAKALLKTTAASIIDQEDLRDALVKDLSLALGEGASGSSALTDLVTDKLASHAAATAKGLLADAGDWAQALIESLAREVPGLAGDALSDKLLALIEPLLAGAQSALKETVDSLASDTGLSARLAKELSAIGTSVKAAERDADKLLQGVREAIGKFQKLADDVIAATEDSAKSKLEARFGWNGADQEGRRVELAGTIAQSTPETAELWRALVTGRLKPFQKILADPSLAPAGITLSADSSLSRFVSRERGFAAELVIFGIDLSFASIVKGKASVTINGSGDIAVTAEGSALRKMEGFDEGRSATFVSTWDLLMTKAERADGRTRAMTVEVGLDHTDRNLKAREVEGMLSGLSGQGLIEPSRVNEALKVYQGWRAEDAAKGKIKGRIGIKLQLPGSAVENMVAAGRDLVRRNQAAQLALFERAVNSQIAAGVASPKQFDRDIDTARAHFKISVKTDDPAAYMLALWNSDVPLLPGQGAGPRMPALAQVIPRAGAFVNMLTTMAQIYDAVPSTGGALPGAWQENDYARAEKKLASSARKWLRLNADFVLWFKSDLHPALVAFYRLLAEMSLANPVEQPAQIEGYAASRLFKITMAHGKDEQVTVV